MSFISDYFKPCGEYVQPSSQYFCYYNQGTLPILIFLVIVIVIAKVIRQKNSISDLSPWYHFRQSIFSYLERENPRLSFFLYLSMAYGIFFLRPLGFTIFNFLPGNTNTTIYIAVFINSITSTFYFFNVIFMINFYAIKIDILKIKGDPSVNANERGFFLKMVLSRTAIFSLYFFIGSIFGLIFHSAPFDFPQGTGKDFNNGSYLWTFRMISYIFASIMIVNRMYYVNYAEKMTQLRIDKKNQIYSVISFAKHVKDHFISRDMIAKIIENIDSEQENTVVQNFDDLLNRKCERSSFLFNATAKALNDSKSLYQPTLKNPMESHLTGTFWLGLTLIGGLYNSIASLILVFSYTLDETTKEGKISEVCLFGMFGFYILETTLQSCLSHLIVTNKETFGDHLDVDDGRSERSESSEFDGRISMFAKETVVEPFGIEQILHQQMMARTVDTNIPGAELGFIQE